MIYQYPVSGAKVPLPLTKLTTSPHTTMHRCNENTSCHDAITLRGATLLLIDKKRKLVTTTISTANDEDGRRLRRCVHRSKRVQFARNLTTTYSHPTTTTTTTAQPASVENNNASCSTWYSDVEYARFLHASRSTVQAAQRALQATGDLSTLDRVQYTILGLEHFMSPSLEQVREQYVRHHCQRMIQLYRRESDSQS
jgi:hypothetical protein